MDRTTTLLTLVLLLCPAGTLAQQSSPRTPEDAHTTRELIAWSQWQTPQPTPQPLPPKDKQVPQPEQPKDQQPTPPVDPNDRQQPIQSHGGITLQQSNR